MPGNDLGALWETPDTPETPTPVPGPSPSPVPPPSSLGGDAAGGGPPADPAAERFGRLEAQINYLGSSLQKTLQLLESRKETPATPTHQPADLDWKDLELMSRDDAVALMDSREPHVNLNRILNQTAKNIYQNLAGEIKKRDEQLQQYREEAAGQLQTLAQQRQEAETRSLLYSKYPDLEAMPDLVSLEWARMASEYQTAPHQFAGLSKEQLIDTLGQRVTNRLAGFAQAGGGAAAPVAAPTNPARRARLEGGTGPRIGAPAPEKDPNKRALADFDKWMRGR